MQIPSEPIVWYCPDLYGGIFLTRKLILQLCTELGLKVSNWDYIAATITIVKDDKCKYTSK